MLAGAAFAGTPTVSATGQVTFDVFNYGTKTDDFQIVSTPVKGGDEYMNLDVTSSDEKAGATFRIQSGTDNKAALNGGIWFKPIEQLKLTVAYGKLAADVTLDGLTFGGDIRGTVLDSKEWKAPSWKAYVGYSVDFGSVTVEAGNGTIYYRDNSKWSYAGIQGYAAALTFKTSLIPSTDLTARYGFYTKDKAGTVDENWMDLDVSATEKIEELSITETVEVEGHLNGGATVALEANVEVPVSEVTVNF